MTTHSIGANEIDVITEFVDVSQGDATVVIDRTANVSVVVDCPSGQERAVLDVLDEYGWPLVDTLLITHSHLDHYGGIAGVATELVERGFGPRRIAFNFEVLLAHGKEAAPADRTGRRRRPIPRVRAHLLQLLDMPRSVELVDLRAGWHVDVTDALQFDTLAPTYREIISAAASQRPNRGSGIVRIRTGDTSILVGADAVAGTWSRLIDDGTVLESDYFRYPHHGALEGGDIDAASLLDVVAADMVVVSVGSDASARNTYRHPNDDLLLAVRDRSSTLVCTEVTEKCYGSVDGPTQCNGRVRVGVGGSSTETTPRGEDHILHVQSEWPTPRCI